MCDFFEEDGFYHHCLHIQRVERLHLREKRERERKKEIEREREKAIIVRM